MLGQVQDRQHVMVVGIDGIGKRILGSSIVEASKRADVELDVLITNQLPLKERAEERIDFMVFMVDMRSRLSFERLYECIIHVERQYALARSCLVLINSETPSKFSFSLEETSQFADAYGMNIHYCTIEDHICLSRIGDRIVKACVNTSRRNGVSPLFMTCLDLDFQRSTVL